MSCQLLEWDSRFFARRIAQAATQRLDEEALGHIERWCDAEAIDCLYFLSELDPRTIALVEKAHFGLKDVRVKFRRPLEAPPALPPQPLVVRPARADDVPALEAIAAHSHGDSRFYADERFGRERADELFRTWIRNSVAGWADDVLVLARAGEGSPLGYITGHRVGQEGKIGLIAVAEEARGAGGAKQLVSTLCARYRAAGLTAMTVVTQGRNQGAQRLYQRMGFTTDVVGLWYHRWWLR
jgi:ribosomal protein S18 acetylase RimI-like enzyme